MKKTIEIYEQTDTADLQILLKDYEDKLESNEIFMDNLKNDKQNVDVFKKLSDDLEIDVHLIRMELNKRLWVEE